MERERVMRPVLSIDTFNDVLVYSERSIDRPDNSFYGAYVKYQNQVGELIGGDVNPPVEAVVETSQALALTRMLLTCSAFQQQLQRERDPLEYLDLVSEKLVEKNLNAAVINELAEHHTTDDILDHYLQKLETWQRELLGTVDSRQHDHHPDEMLELADILGIASIVLPETDEKRQATLHRYNQVTAKLSQTLIEHDKVGYGVVFGDLNQDSRSATAFVSSIVTGLQRLRQQEGDDAYRSVYNYTTSRLHEPKLSMFLELLPKEPTPRIYGARAQIIEGRDSRNLYETFEEGQLLWAKLSGGGTLPLPNIEYRSRTILDYSTNREHEMYETQHAVEYDDLTDDEKIAIQIAIHVDDNDLLRTETLPEYKRVALWRRESGNEFYTVVHRDGLGRLMNKYPDHHGFVTSDNQRQLDYPVQQMETVSDGFMAVRYNGDYMLRSTFRDAEPNFFGPKDKFANAFWISGNPRRVWSDRYKHLMVEQHSDFDEDRVRPILQSRFTIVPVRFLKITEDTSRPEDAPTHTHLD